MLLVTVEEGALAVAVHEEGARLPTVVNKEVFPVAAQEEDTLSLHRVKGGRALHGGMVGRHRGSFAVAAVPGPAAERHPVTVYRRSPRSVVWGGATVRPCPGAKRCIAATKHSKRRHLRKFPQ